MNSKEVQYVLAIAKYKTLSAAARSLDLTQPSLSKFLQNLEGKLNTILFERYDNKLILTYAGTKYLEIGMEMLELDKELKSTLLKIHNNIQGNISIGITPTRGRYVLPEILPEFKRAFPNYSIEIVEAGVKNLNDKLISGELDLAFYTVFDEYCSSFSYEIICKEEIVFGISPCNPNYQFVKEIGNRRCVEVRDFEHELFIMIDSKYRTRKAADQILDEAGINPRMMTIQAVETALSIISSGIGVCFCTDMCENFFSAGRPITYCTILNHGCVWDFVIAYNKDCILSPAVKRMIELTKTHFKKSV